MTLPITMFAIGVALALAGLALVRAGARLLARRSIPPG